jgi:hypothetical protein
MGSIKAVSSKVDNRKYIGLKQKLHNGFNQTSARLGVSVQGCTSRAAKSAPQALSQKALCAHSGMLKVMVLFE